MAEQSYSHLIPVPATAVNDIAESGTTRTLPFLQSFAIMQVRLVLAEAVATATTITMNREKEPGSATNDVAICTFIVPDLAALGDVFYIDVAEFGDCNIAPGESVNWVSSGEGTTGQAFFAVLGYYYEEGPNPVRSFTTADKMRSGTGDLKYLAATEV
jgi:hypothetical protein